MLAREKNLTSLEAYLVGDTSLVGRRCPDVGWSCGAVGGGRMGEDFRFRDSRVAFSLSIAVGSVGHTSTVVRESPSIVLVCEL